MLNIEMTPSPEWVTLKGIAFNGKKADFKVLAGAIPTTLGELFMNGENPNLLDHLTREDVADRVHDWECDGLKVTGSKKMLECTRENVLAFMEDIPQGYSVLASALTQGYLERLLKNLKGLSDTTGTVAKDSAEPAKDTKKRAKKKKTA